MGKIFKVFVKIPERTEEYVVGEKEKDLLLKALKDCDVTVQELSLDSHSDDLNMSTPTSLNIPEI